MGLGWDAHFHSLDPRCAAFDLVDVYCGTSNATNAYCCGLCFNTSISGQGQFFWAVFSTLMVMLCVLIAPESSNQISILQMLLTDSFLFSIVVKVQQGANEKGMARWHAEFGLPQALAYCPIMWSVIFSPSWTAIMSKPEAVKALIKEQAKVEKEGGFLLEKNADDSSSSALTSSPTTYISPEEHQYMIKRKPHRVLLRWEAERRKELRRWGFALSLLWLAHLIIWTVLYVMLVWPARSLDPTSNNAYFQLLCETPLIADHGNEYWIIKPKNAGIVFLLLGAAIFVIQIVAVAEGKGGTELFFDICTRPRKNPDKNDNDDPTRRSTTDSKQPYKFRYTRKRIIILHWVSSFVVYIFWLAINSWMYFNALSHFLMNGSDIWTYGQVEQIAVLLPDVVALINAIYQAHTEEALAEYEIRKWELATEELKRLEAGQRDEEDPEDPIITEMASYVAQQDLLKYGGLRQSGGDHKSKDTCRAHNKVRKTRWDRESNRHKYYDSNANDLAANEGVLSTGRETRSATATSASRSRNQRGDSRSKVGSQSRGRTSSTSRRHGRESEERTARYPTRSMSRDPSKYLHQI